MLILIQSLSVVAMILAIYGSKLFVDNKFDLGSKLFIVGNSINIILGLAVSNLYLTLGQLGLLLFTLPMVKLSANKLFYSFVVMLSIVLLIILPLHFGFKASILEMLSTACAWYGAYKMSKGDFATMAKCWIIADMGFVYIGVTSHLIGLTLQASIFVYHGYKRLVK